MRFVFRQTFITMLFFRPTLKILIYCPLGTGRGLINETIIFLVPKLLKWVIIIRRNTVIRLLAVLFLMITIIIVWSCAVIAAQKYNIVY
jgi:hypothetical protein